MESPVALDLLMQAVCAVGAAWSGALLGSSATAGADLRAMSDDGLVRVVEALGALALGVESLQARSAGELAERSLGRSADDDVVRRRGYASTERLVAGVSGGRYVDAARLVAVGRAVTPRLAFGGGELPPRFAVLAAAFERGEVCVDAADLIRRLLERVALHADPGDLGEAEALLVERAPIVGIDGLTRLIKALEARLDPDGARPREDELRARRSLKIWEDAHGMINLRGAFDPASGAPIKVALESLVGAELHRTRGVRQHGGDGDGGGQVGAVAEVRTIGQLHADALADVARCALSAADAPGPLRSAMVVARVDAGALVSGRGHATIDGVDQPISVASARELAMWAGVAPLLMAPRCERLDLGRSSRLFTAAQKVALAERDGGCAFPGCARPPSYTQAHHIEWWERDGGSTDLANGILLCSHHHHRVHADGWRIEIHDGGSWFVPPAHVDPECRPRAGNVSEPWAARLRGIAA